MPNFNFKLIALSVLLVVAGLIVFAATPDRKSVPDKQEQAPTEDKNIADKNDYDPVSIQAMMDKEYLGKDLTLGPVLDNNPAYIRYYITYDSNGLKISGIMNVPKGIVPAGGFPVLILNHGYIDTSIYTNGRGLRREQDYLARQGYIVIHPDYRNHADSDKDPEADVNFRLGYVEDVINAVMAVKNSSSDFLNKENIGMLGHSMGGGIAWNLMVIKPDLVSAFVLFAPVSVDADDNFQRWIVRRPETASRILEKHGDKQANPEFWQNVSAINFLDKAKAPIMLHHGTADESVPITWSDKAVKILQDKNKEITYYTYIGQPHEFTSSWGLVMQRTTEFFDKNLK